MSKEKAAVMDPNVVDHHGNRLPGAPAFDAEAPVNQYPKFRYHPTEAEPHPVRPDLTEVVSQLVVDPDDEAENTPDADGWMDLKRDAVDLVNEAKKAAKKAVSAVVGKKRSAPPAVSTES
jgi:hypothetical protein